MGLLSCVRISYNDVINLLYNNIYNHPFISDINKPHVIGMFVIKEVQTTGKQGKLLFITTISDLSGNTFCHDCFT